MNKKLIELFEGVQAIPYKCRAENIARGTNTNWSYANCNQKRNLLRRSLDLRGFESRDLDAIFDWNDLPIPMGILKILKNSGTFQKHHLLEVNVNCSYLKVDPTWNLELEHIGFPVTKNWDGKNDTEQITRGKILFYNLDIEKISLPYFPEERIKFAEEFYRWMPKFSKLAKPHLSIFRPAEEDQETLKDGEFIENPVGYLCSMRLAFEKEYEGPIYQNNLASLWGFPVDRINPLFLTDKTSLG